MHQDESTKIPHEYILSLNIYFKKQIYIFLLKGEKPKVDKQKSTKEVINKPKLLK